MFSIVFLFCLVRTSSGVIYQLNDSDYALMPPVFHMDPYEACYEDPEALYCTVDTVLVSDEPSSLLTMIKEYSAHTTSHYNHTLLRHGICLTHTCKKFYEVAEGDLGSTLEACLNETYYNRYKLKVRLLDGYDCSKREMYKDIDYVDLTVGGICISILLANLIGSFCDYFCGKDYAGSRFVYCFSIFRNWKKLLAPASASSEPRLHRLKGLHGIRAIHTFLVIVGHSFLTSIAFIENSKDMENMLITIPYQMLLNGTVIMQTFFMMSSFLLVYNWLIHAEKHEPSWKSLPKLFLIRWLRLTPPYAVILALTATWFGRITSGPLWKILVSNEMSDCRRDWWKNLLYINNYFDDSECMLQSWYLAADTQLYYMAAVIFVMCRTLRARQVVLSLVFVAGLVIPAVQTYWWDLHGVLIVSPEIMLKLFQNDPTFYKVYKRGHTNLTGYVIGMAMGYMLYNWQKTGDPKTFRKFRYLFWTLVPLACLCCYSASIFFADGPPPPFYVNLLFAAFMKPVFGIIIGTGMVGVIIQFEDLYRTILEWRIWIIPSRLSFSAYLLHIMFIRNLMVMRTTVLTASTGISFLVSSEILLASFIAAFFFWMLVEAPFGNIVRECLVKPNVEAKLEMKEANKKSS